MNCSMIRVSVVFLLMLVSQLAAGQRGYKRSNGLNIPPVAPPPQKPKVYDDELKPVATLAEAGILDPYKLGKVDEFVNDAIMKGAFPGCRVFAARNSRVFYDKSF